MPWSTYSLLTSSNLTTAVAAWVAALRSVIAEIDPDCEAAVLDILGQSGLTLVGQHKRKKKPGPWYGVGLLVDVVWMPITLSPWESPSLAVTLAPQSPPWAANLW